MLKYEVDGPRPYKNPRSKVNVTNKPYRIHRGSYQASITPWKMFLT